MGGPFALGCLCDTLPVVFAHQLVLLPLTRNTLFYFSSCLRPCGRGGILVTSVRRVRIPLRASSLRFGPQWCVVVVGGIRFGLGLPLVRIVIARTPGLRLRFVCARRLLPGRTICGTAMLGPVRSHSRGLL
jgi:hypothetical protein